MKFSAWLLGSLLFCLSGLSHAWWNDEWAFRKKISLDTSAAGLETKANVDQVTILVRLHSGNFSFIDAKEDGSDIRFVANDDKTPLKYHIEFFDALNELGVAWVQIPKLSAVSASEFIWVYSGNENVGPGDDVKGSYSVNDTAILHFNEKSDLPKDATAYLSNPTESTATLGIPGLIDGGAKFTGDNKLTFAASPPLRIAAAAGTTVSMWIKMSEAAPNAVLYERIDGVNALVMGIEGGKPYVQANLNGIQTKAVSTAPVSVGKWHHVAVTLKDGLLIYVDGVPTGNAGAFAIDMGGAITVGNSAAGGLGFKGDVDELQIANVARSLDWVRLSALSQGLESKLMTFGQDEQSGGSGSSSYMSILLGSVTLDGWIVIAILVVMAVISWFVMWAKTRFIGQMQKGNKLFHSNFQRLLAELMGLGDDPKPAAGASGNTATIARNVVPGKEKKPTLAVGANSGLGTSPLYRLYGVGLGELKRRFDHAEKIGGDKTLSDASINAIKATLDATLVREMHRLNSQMVLLTIAISGGPFLGLLGTVVGVMITFAAIAAAGDVNVNAIAPGIAAALVATVAGLAVAIPALFGYNYLTSRIKNLIAEMQVFNDEFITKVAETYTR